ncbi:MAG: hypothetical protein IKV35_00795, partial [Clostridia bacterium]|nr:hypothetical protein [Clostridia bacterium]
WTFENAVVNFSVRYGHGYKSLDKESQTYIYPVSNDCVCLSVSGEGVSKTETVCCMLKAGAPALGDEAKVEAIVATGTVFEKVSETHRWRCTCGNMINQNPCPHCGRTI